MMRVGRDASTGPACPRRLARAAATVLTMAALACAAAAAGSRVDTVVIASGADLESANPLVTIHPLARQVQRYALFTTLARYGDSLEPRPYAAHSWQWSADRRTLTFHLQTGLRWHDGRPTVAGDAAFTLDAARDPATGYPRASDLAGLTRVEAPDDSTLVLRFGSAQPDFPAVLCELPILPRHLLGNIPRSAMRTAPFNIAPVGNGPFRFVERRAGERWVFERDDGFPASMGGPPALRRLVIAVVDEPATKFAGLVSGELDLAGIAPTMAALASRDSSLRVLAYPALSVTALVFNAARPPFDDVRVRRAVSLSLRRERIVRAALAGYATPAAGPVPAEHPLAERSKDSGQRSAVGGRTSEVGELLRTRADTERVADSLLDAAGWRRADGGARECEGQRLAFELLTVGSGDNAIEQLVQADLAERGIAVSIRQLELGAFLAIARAPVKKFDALLTGIPGDLSLAYLASMFDGRSAGGALDYAGWHTPRLDGLFARARAAGDGEARRLAWRDIQLELGRDVPAAWIYHARGVQGVTRRLRGVRMDLRGELVSLHDWTLAPAGAAGPGHD